MWIWEKSVVKLLGEPRPIDGTRGRHPPQEVTQYKVFCGFRELHPSMEPRGGAIPPRGLYNIDAYVSSNVRTLLDSGPASFDVILTPT